MSADNEGAPGGDGRPAVDPEARMVQSIEALWHGCGGTEVVLAGGDDCAVLRPTGAGEDLLVTVDQLVEDRHFVRGRHDPAALGRKALVRSLSDIAAMGGRPCWCLQTVCLPEWAVGPWHSAFQDGFREAARLPGATGLALVGGDVASGDRFVATVALVGKVARGQAVLRSGARPGDQLYVSGCLGGSLLGLATVLEELPEPPWKPEVRRHMEPRPRLALGRALGRARASAAIDLSDGLAIDAHRLARASGTALVLDPGELPRYPGATVREALCSGEEYELLFTLGPSEVPPTGADVRRIGYVEEGSGVWLCSEDGREALEPRGYSHFKGQASSGLHAEQGVHVRGQPPSGRP